MNVRVVICLLSGLCCAPLAAQETLVASRATALPPVVAAAPVRRSSAINAAVPADAAFRRQFDLPIEALALPVGAVPYEAGLPPAPTGVCTALPVAAIASPKADYAFDHLQFTAAAFRGTFSHDNLVKMARNFVPGQPLPDAPSYVALTSRQKFDLFVHRSHSFDTVSGALSDALTAQITGGYPSFGGGMPGYGKRLGAAMAGAESASFFGTFVFPTLLHQDPRYFRSQQTAISERLSYAASRVVIGRSDSGRSVFNSSLIMSEFVQAAVSNAYIPYRRESVPGTVENALTGLGSVAQARILTEFWPDIKMFLTRHEPKKMQQWQDRWNNSGFAQFARK
jgi:hypothetical protein